MQRPDEEMAIDQNSPVLNDNDQDNTSEREITHENLQFLNDPSLSESEHEETEAHHVKTKKQREDNQKIKRTFNELSPENAQSADSKKSNVNQSNDESD